MDYNSRRPVIIGAGIAGLSAANYLIDHGQQPLIIESGIVGSPKVCGEFFSAEAVPILENWQVPYIAIKEGSFITKNYQYNFVFPQAAASVTRSMCEKHLADRARIKGAEIIENTSVVEIYPPRTTTDSYIILLSSGQTVVSEVLFVATGKWSHFVINSDDTPRYVGIKAHFTNICVSDKLMLFLAPGAYVGLTPISDTVVNICCLAQYNLVAKAKSPELFMEQLIETIPVFKRVYAQAECLFDTWLTAYVKQFGKKVVPPWPRAYFIGDAAATIYPASGNGLAMGLTSGIMAAHYFLYRNSSDMRKAWQNRYASRLKWASLLHKLFISPSLAEPAFKLAQKIPKLSHFLYYSTRDYEKYTF